MQLEALSGLELLRGEEIVETRRMVISSYSTPLFLGPWVLFFELLMEVRGEEGQILAKKWAKDRVDCSTLGIIG